MTPYANKDGGWGQLPLLHWMYSVTLCNTPYSILLPLWLFRRRR